MSIKKLYFLKEQWMKYNYKRFIKIQPFSNRHVIIFGNSNFNNFSVKIIRFGEKKEEKGKGCNEIITEKKKLAKKEIEKKEKDVFNNENIRNNVNTKISDITEKEGNYLFKENKKNTIFFESDRIIKCISGKGGDGAISFKKFKKKVFGNIGIPNGGRGGNGGSIFLCFANTNIKRSKKKTKKNNDNDNSKHIFINNLSELPCVLNASNGKKGKANQLKGKDGANIFVYVDTPCFVYELFAESVDYENEKKEEKKEKEREKCEETAKNKNITTLNISTTNTIIETYIKYYEKMFSALKKSDPIYVKRNCHILKELIQIEKQIKKVAFLGFLNEQNNCLLLSKGGLGGKGNNINNFYSNEKGENGKISFIKIINKCISDVCFIGFDKSGKSTLLSLIGHKIYTLNNIYVLKKIFYRDNFQISVADFFTSSHDKHTDTNTDMNIDTDKQENNINEKVKKKGVDKTREFCINPNLFKYIHLTYLYVIVLDFHRDIIEQFLKIRNELKSKDQRLAQIPYIVVINKCDILFKENMKKAEDAYDKIKKENENVSIFFLSGKYALGIENFVSCLRSTIEKLKQI